MADSVRGGSLPALIRWALLASLTLLVAVLVVAGGAFIARRHQTNRRTGSAPVPTVTGIPAPDTGTPGERSALIDATTAADLLGTRARIVASPSATTQDTSALHRPSAPVWRLPRMAAPPTLDGRLDEWSSPPLDVSALIFGQSFWSGSADCSATAYGGWTDQAAYLAVTVTDDVFSQPSRGSNLYLGDSIELQLDADLLGDWDVGEYNDDDWQVGLSPGDFAAQPAEAFVWRPVTGAADDVRVVSQRAPAGYTVEVALPWSLLEVDPTRTRAIGMAVNVSDNDDPRPAQLSMISSAPLRSWSDPRTFGTVLLVRD